MDPHAARQRLRDLLGGDHSAIESLGSEQGDDILERLTQAEETFQALDRWLCRGGDSPWERLQAFTCKDFEGYWPVGTAAVVVGRSQREALSALVEALDKLSLPQGRNAEGAPDLTLEPLDLTTPSVRILDDGED